MNELKFQKALGDLIDTEIGLCLNDCQFFEGFLLDVKSDHIVVDVNKTVFYFPLQHIQTISSNTKSLLVSTEIVHYVNKNYLVDVLKSSRDYWVSINSLSDQGIFGVLSKISDDYVTVINNSELLYVPRCHISNITSHIPEKRIIVINKHEQLAIEASQNELQIINESTLKNIELETKTKKEVPILDISPGEVVEDEYLVNERPEVDPQTRLEIYFTLVKLLKNKLSNRNVDKEGRENIIQGFINHSADEEKELIDSSVGDAADYQVEKQVVVENPQPINEIKPIKNTEVPILEALAEDQTELQLDFQETPGDTSRFVRPDLLEGEKVYSFEADRLGVLDLKNRFSLERQFLPVESKAKRKKTLLTAWNTLNNERNLLTNPNNPTIENELLDNEVGTIKLEESLDSDNVLVQLVSDQNPSKNIGPSDEKCEATEIIASQLPIDPKVVKKILEKQYLSLMKHAETNVFLLAQRRLNQSEEAQYLALLKHAENMYRELKS
ncbi:DUF2642 domain-containing protein [Sporosarcina sp. G11-34]|uniref:DUF2642 domain-containing protein n=1 Tax=Sporosarcina sp. G11-34 TaxID=2849605 RepID=UPI0022A98AFE|nr:DUF2642 domain-containing protein [Sporosarcina sp. G11-34]MCZ2259998.1 YuzF family protein [Sporosarcina sp. G11-34]